jgi:hypothetical protein
LYQQARPYRDLVIIKITKYAAGRKVQHQLENCNLVRRNLHAMRIPNLGASIALQKAMNKGMII